MGKCGESIVAMYPLFRAGEGGSIPTSPLQMVVEEVEFDQAKSLNRLWHSRLPAFRSPFGSPCYVAEFDWRAYAVAIWSNPIARMLPQKTWLELRRLAISPEAPKNTASWMLGVMARLIRKKLPMIEVLVSYQDTEVHTGTIYRAAGWVKTVETIDCYGNNHHWNNRGKHGHPSQTDAVKNRFERRIRCGLAPAEAEDLGQEAPVSAVKEAPDGH